MSISVSPSTVIKLDYSSFEEADSELKAALDEMDQEIENYQDAKKKLHSSWKGEAAKNAKAVTPVYEKELKQMVKELKTLKKDLITLKKAFKTVDTTK